MFNYKCLFVFIAVFVFSILHITNALKCYTCEYPTNEDCKDPFDMNQYTFSNECKDVNYVCVKHKKTDTYYEPERLVRGCVTEDYCEEEGSSVHCSTCTSDLCNSSVKMNSSLIFVSVVIFASLIRFTNYV